MTHKIRNFSIIAHIDHGKSTLADRLLELTGAIDRRQMKEQVLDTMDIERERGITIKLQPARMVWQPNKLKIENSKIETRNKLEIRNSKLEISDLAFELNLIDTPGHVDFSYEVSRSLAAVEGVLLVIDATQGVQAQTLANLHLAEEAGLAVIPVINKIDLPAADVEKTTNELNALGIDFVCPPIAISAKSGTNIEKVLEAIIKFIPPPSGREKTVARALIFDSYFDSYRGVIVYVRVVDGTIRAGDELKTMQTGKVAEALEVGGVCLGLHHERELRAGQIGYIVTSLKDIAAARVGDTITTIISRQTSVVSSRSSGDQRPTANDLPLAGYKEPQPMVYAGLYTASGDDYQKLRDALAKLKLNDAALQYEPSSSTAFGFGFRAGFLGLLHLEVVKERLEREYDLDLVVTVPTVAYRPQSQNPISNAQPLTSNQWEEPWVKLEIILPEEYLGGAMQLVIGRRGVLGDVKYLGERVVLEAEVPLGEVIIDFYDKLKAATSGYGSVSYDLIGYRPADLVQLDILVAGDKVDALSRLVPKVNVDFIARQVVAKLKEAVPRQSFEVKLQAAVGAKIIASERLAPFRKDVTEKLYGGDITRKRKLLEKQKKGKKKMARLGTVEVPTEVFVKLLKY
ncbi:MAG TPA: translation elongation factor 4 [Patescibacteria group bacterium]|nr:translation elongation factor 4 [Patescibacteria group bacterium]